MAHPSIFLAWIKAFLAVFRPDRTRRVVALYVVQPFPIGKIGQFGGPQLPY